MAWNTSGKSLAVATRALVPVSEKRVPVGAPAAMNRSITDGTQGYRDGWDLERAYRDGVSKVTWVWRSIDAIASNQAKLPMQLRKDNRVDGEIVNEHDLLRILNDQTNNGENSFIFRYRMSAQLLMSTRGVFIEVIRDKSGKPMALNLLPPQHTSPLPHPTNFVRGYEVAVPGTKTLILKPEEVIWIRRPHPLDPYLSMTPMESAGIAIEIELLAKMYNRNFLLNDGRPGGLLVLNGEIDEDDKHELQQRFRGNISGTGKIGVISSDDGAQFLDTAANPRDAAYVQMRELTKEEILTAFGVPESVLGNASGRTFSNAMEEGKVFWMETMKPHLELLARPLSHLDPHHYVGFNVSEVPILVLAEQEQARFALEEFRAGLISTNEYRSSVGRKKVESDLADSLLANPNLTPLGNTEKATHQNTDVGNGTPLDVQAGQSQQQSVTQFDPNTGNFEDADGEVNEVGGRGTEGIELPALEAPSELTEEEAAEDDTGGPLVKALRASLTIGERIGRV
jgi:HK97 family phage portal protein